MNISFRSANKNDIEILISFISDFYSLDNYPFDKNITEKVVNKLIDDNSLGYIWLIEYQDKPIGYLVLTFGFSIEYHGRNAFIDEIFFSESYRNRGFGTQTMTFIDEICRKCEIKAIHLEVERDNIEALAVYRKSGFKNTNRFLLTKWL